MATIPKKASDRLSKQLGRFQKILASAKDRDVNESDTVTIITDMLADLFGFDKYTELTSEQAIRGTYCDLAVKLDGVIKYLIEVKAVGLTLKDSHLRQAVNYGAGKGIPWVVLTNGVTWEIFRIKLDGKVEEELICSIDFLELNPRKKESIDELYLLCREGLAKAAIEQYHAHAQNVNRFVVGALIQSDPVMTVIRRELRRLAPESKVSTDEISKLLPDVLKRDVLEGDAAKSALRRVESAINKKLRATKRNSSDSE